MWQRERNSQDSGSNCDATSCEFLLGIKKASRIAVVEPARDELGEERDRRKERSQCQRYCHRTDSESLCDFEKIRDDHGRAPARTSSPFSKPYASKASCRLRLS